MVHAVRLPDWIWHWGLRGAFLGLRVYWWLWRPRTQSVHIAVWHQGRVLVIRNSYKHHTSLPAGGVGRGEALADAAARELREEVGIGVAPSALNLASTLTTHGEGKIDSGHFFEIEFPSSPEIRVDGREVVSGRFESLEAALTLDLSEPVRLYLQAVQERRTASNRSPSTG